MQYMNKAGMIRSVPPAGSGSGPKPERARQIPPAPCARCSKVEPLFLVDGRRLCVRCFELNLAVEPRRAGRERRHPDNDPRGYGRRYQDNLN